MFKIILTETTYHHLIAAGQQQPAGHRSHLCQLLTAAPGRVALLTAQEAASLQTADDFLRHPSSLYVLDIPPSEAQRIRQSFGVCCLSARQPDLSMLIDTNDEHTTNEREPLGQGWHTVLQSLRHIPSNALLLTDRYLFSTVSARIGNGIANVHGILEVLLPQKFLGEYHVTVVFDVESMHSTYTFQDVATRLNRLKQSLHRDYPIQLEVIGITPSCPIYNRLHNRRIVSNYFIVKLEHKLAAFNGNVATTQQTITPQVLFTEDSLQRHSSPPLKSIEQILTTLRSFSGWTTRLTDHTLYDYALNGRWLERCAGVRNRIIK